MGISSVASSAYANQSAQADRSKQMHQAEKIEKKPPPVPEPVEKKAVPPKPVANAEGQSTGRVINVTA